MKKDQEKNITETIKKDQENDKLDEDMIYMIKYYGVV